MSEILRQALRDEAERAGSYAVYDRALRTARRRQRTRLASVAAGIAVVVVLLLTGLPGALAHRAFEPADNPADAPSLPDRLGFPPAFYPGLRSSPPGPASVVFGGQGFPISRFDQLLDDEGDLAVVGATSERYRTWLIGSEVHAGEDVLLSPDGTRLATDSGMQAEGASVVDLRTGGVIRLTAFGARDHVTPLAWSPDGRTLAVQVVADGRRDSIGLVEVPDGAYRRIGDVDRGQGVLGSEFAFAPDGRSFAYQFGQQIVVADLDLRERARLVAPAGEWLAGKGAWTPDGAGLVLLHHWPDPETWSLVVRDPATGAVRKGPDWRIRSGDLAALRLLGWGPDGDPVVVAFRAEPGLPAEVRDKAEPETAYQVVHSITVLSLPASGAPRTLLTAPHNIMSIDIADRVIAGGRVRPGDPPRYGPLTVAGGLLILGAATLVALLARRRRRRRRSAGPPGPSRRTSIE